MTNKLMITEINRIQELMGKPLIMEHWVNTATEVLELISKKITNRSLKTTLNDTIEKLLTDLGKSTDELQIRAIMTKLINSSDEIAEIVVPMIRKSFTSLEENTILNFKNDLEKRIKNSVIPPEDASIYIERFLNEKLTSDMKPIRNSLKAELENVATKAIVDLRNLTYGQAFKLGFNSNTGAGLFAKRVVPRNIPIPGLRGYFRKNIQKLTPTESKIVKQWFWSGIGNSKQIIEIFNKHGINKAAVNMSGQLFRKWIFWSGVITATNIMVDKVPKLWGKKLNKSELEATGFMVTDNLESAGLGYVAPWTLIVKYIIFPFAQEGALTEPTDKFINYLKGIRDKSEDKVNKIENNINTGKEKVKDKVENIIIKDDELGFRAWCKKNKKEFVEYKGGIGKTTENGKDIFWYWDTDKGTFLENKPEL
jgi:hypothetical protein